MKSDDMDRDTKDSLSSLPDDNILELYSDLVKELLRRNIIRSSNITGDLGEWFAIHFYSSQLNEPLTLASKGAKYIDAINERGEQFSIKTIKKPNSNTSKFYDITEDMHDKKFDFLVLVVLNEDFSPSLIIESSWETFHNLKKWQSYNKAWFIHYSKKLEMESRLIYRSSDSK